MEHKYADILRAIADGKEIQWQNACGHWFDEDTNEALENISREAYDVTRYRIKPATITINGIEIPEPVREPLLKGEKYWSPGRSAYDLTDKFEWYGSKTDEIWLKRGLIHLTKEAAEQHAKALILASGGEV